MHKTRFKQLIRFVENIILDKHFDMNYVLSVPYRGTHDPFCDLLNPEGCGTTGCVGGHLPIAFPDLCKYESHPTQSQPFVIPIGMTFDEAINASPRNTDLPYPDTWKTAKYTLAKILKLSYEDVEYLFGVRMYAKRPITRQMVVARMKDFLKNPAAMYAGAAI